jgi:hypothetical protein
MVDCIRFFFPCLAPTRSDSGCVHHMLAQGVPAHSRLGTARSECNAPLDICHMAVMYNANWQEAA